MCIFGNSGSGKSCGVTRIVQNIMQNKDAYAYNANLLFFDSFGEYKNAFGKSRVIVIQSQLGDPICAFSGESVYYEVCEDLPKTTKLMIDGKALYIHHANFQIIDKALLSNPDK